MRHDKFRDGLVTAAYEGTIIILEVPSLLAPPPQNTAVEVKPS